MIVYTLWVVGGGLKEKVDVKPLDEIHVDKASLNVSYCNSLGENEVHGKLGRLLVRQTYIGSQIYQLLFLDNT